MLNFTVTQQNEIMKIISRAIDFQAAQEKDNSKFYLITMLSIEAPRYHLAVANRLYIVVL